MQIFQDTTDNILCILSTQCGAWDNLCEIAYFSVGVNGRKDFFL